MRPEAGALGRLKGDNRACTMTSVLEIRNLAQDRERAFFFLPKADDGDNGKRYPGLWERIWNKACYTAGVHRQVVVLGMSNGRCV